MLYHIIVASTGMLLLILVWLGVQHMTRKSSPDLPDDYDVMQDRMGCGGCHHAEDCGLTAPSIRESAEP